MICSQRYNFIFDTLNRKNLVIAFSKTLEIGETAKIEKYEWKRKSLIGVGICSEMKRIGKKMSVKTMDTYYLIKRIS